jgi:hypothetical protein
MKSSYVVHIRFYFSEPIDKNVASWLFCHRLVWKHWHTLQRQNAENLKQIFPEKEYRGLSPNFHIHVSVSELYISAMGLPFLLEQIWTDPGNIKIAHRHMNVEIGADDAKFPEKEYINGIAVAVQLLGKKLSLGFSRGPTVQLY